MPSRSNVVGKIAGDNSFSHQCLGIQYSLVFISSILNADDSQLSEGGHESEDAKESESHSAIDEPQTETPTAAETDQTETVDASEADQPENKVGVN